MKTYLDAVKHVLEHGVKKEDRTGVGTLSCFGMQQRYDLSQGFPAMTTKKLAWKACVGELLWFIEGSGDERRLAEITHGTRDASKATIWTPNAEADYWKPKAKYEGDLGRVYGVQWRDWQRAFHGETGYRVDQLLELIDGIKRDPNGRRHIITAWNPGELDDMALPPCHCFAQFYVSPLNREEIKQTYHAYRNNLQQDQRYLLDNVYEGKEKTKEILKSLGLPVSKLSCQMYQRSCDMFLGVPFNIASYALFTHMIAQECDLVVGEFVHTLGDAHIYLNHIDQVKTQLERDPLPLPQLWLNPEIKDITKFTMDDIKLINYQSHSAIKAEMAV